MIFLASSSQTRAEILRQSGINFEQIFFNYDEGGVDKNLPPYIYVQKVVAAKKEQFLKANSGVKNVVFADSVVVCGGKILGKARDEADALKMLRAQSGASCAVYTAMIFCSKALELSTLSVASFEFAEFNEADLKGYIASGDWRGKAGAMSIEGFNEKYIKSSRGSKFTAMGLDLENLKRFVW